MAYTKHALIDGQTIIDAELLGEMENGIKFAYDKAEELTGAVDEMDEAIANQGLLLAELSRTSKEYTDNKVAEIVGSAPETLNTLNELAAALANEPNFARYVVDQLAQKAYRTELNDYVTKTMFEEVLGASLTEIDALLGG